MQTQKVGQFKADIDGKLFVESVFEIAFEKCRIFDNRNLFFFLGASFEVFITYASDCGSKVIGPPPGAI